MVVFLNHDIVILYNYKQVSTAKSMIYHTFERFLRIHNIYCSKIPQNGHTVHHQSSTRQ